MKSTGMVRRIDDLGRIVLPIQIRNTIGIQNRDPLEIFVEGDRIVLKKYHPSCIFCDQTEGLTLFQDKRICKDCLSALKR